MRMHGVVSFLNGRDGDLIRQRRRWVLASCHQISSTDHIERFGKLPLIASRTGPQWHADWATAPIGLLAGISLDQAQRLIRPLGGVGQRSI
jgi:hypothetical protein